MTGWLSKGQGCTFTSLNNNASVLSWLSIIWLQSTFPILLFAICMSHVSISLPHCSLCTLHAFIPIWILPIFESPNASLKISNATAFMISSISSLLATPCTPKSWKEFPSSEFPWYFIWTALHCLYLCVSLPKPSYSVEDSEVKVL